MLQFANQNPHSGFAFSQRVLGATPLAYVDEGDDDAVDLVLDSAVGLQARELPAAVPAMHLALGRSRSRRTLRASSARSS